MGDAVARALMRQLAAGLRFLWENSLIHRDLKPQNLLLSTKDGRTVLKIGDFGFARYLVPQGLADTLCGSPLYMAPEIIQNKRYDAKADLWSVGAILFQLVTGKPPFDGNNQYQLFQNILASNELQFPQDVLSGLHPDCIDLCRSLLRRNPVERLAFDGFFNHNFLAMPRTSESECMQNPIDDKLGKAINVNLSDLSHIESMKTGSMDRGLLNISAPKVTDSFESIEREYVLVNTRFASMDLLPSSLEMSMPDSYATKLTSCINSNASVGESMRNSVSTSSLIPQASMESESPSDPRRRLQYLYQYVYALTEIAREKLNVGMHLESFSIELVILAIWKEALQACDSWMVSISEVDARDSSSANDCPFTPDDDHSSLAFEASFDVQKPSSVCSWARREFLAAYDRAEKLSSSFQDINGSMQMPDAMEIIFQTALSAGKNGAVEQLMGHMSRAEGSYSLAMTLLAFIITEAQSLPLNPQFVLSRDDQRRIHKYIISLKGHQKQCKMGELDTKLSLSDSVSSK